MSFLAPMRRLSRRGLVVALMIVGLTGASAAAASNPVVPYDWPQFDGRSSHPGQNPFERVLSPTTVGGLTRLFRVTLPGVADSPPIYLHNIATRTGIRDLLYLNTTDGHTVAVDAHSGKLIWAVQSGPGGCRINNGSPPCYTTSAPAAAPPYRSIYAYGLDGKVHQYAAGTGTEILGGGWPETTTLKGFDEKGSADLTVADAGGNLYLYAANGGYPGDRGDYQGHVTVVNLATGAQRVFNTLCSDQTVHFASRATPDCGQVQSAVWARAGVVYDAMTAKIYLTTGNGDFDPAAHDWGDTVLALNPDGTGTAGGPVDSYTPTNYAELQADDGDLGSTAPAIVAAPAASAVRHLAVQAGKDAVLRLLNLDDLSGRGGPGHTGGELALLPVPQGGEVLTQPASWVDPVGGTSWVFAANGNGIAGVQITVHGTQPTLSAVWQLPTGGTSPIVANGVLYYLTAHGARALDPTTGAVLWADTATTVKVHWQSPIIAGGRLYYPDNSGHLTAYHLPPH